eukprot:7164899-Alexandrium_andersonii.AAC.1
MAGFGKVALSGGRGGGSATPRSMQHAACELAAEGPLVAMTGLGRARKAFHVWVLAAGLCLSAAPVQMSIVASQN